MGRGNTKPTIRRETCFTDVVTSWFTFSVLRGFLVLRYLLWKRFVRTVPRMSPTSRYSAPSAWFGLTYINALFVIVLVADYVITSSQQVAPLSQAHGMALARLEEKRRQRGFSGGQCMACLVLASLASSHSLTHSPVSVSARDTSCLVWSPFE